MEIERRLAPDYQDPPEDAPPHAPTPAKSEAGCTSGTSPGPASPMLVLAISAARIIVAHSGALIFLDDDPAADLRPGPRRLDLGRAGSAGRGHRGSAA